MFEVKIRQVTKKETRSKSFMVERFGLWVNRYPNDFKVPELAGQLKDIQLAVVEDGMIVTYPFLTLWVKHVEDK